LDFIPFFRIAIALLYAFMLGEAGLNKLLSGPMPDWFAEPFRKTWLGKLPIAPMYWMIALSEVAIAGVAVASVVMGEPWGEPTLLSAVCLGASVLFTGLCFGQRVIGDYAGAASAFVYSALSILLFGALQLIGA